MISWRTPLFIAIAAICLAVQARAQDYYYSYQRGGWGGSIYPDYEQALPDGAHGGNRPTVPGTRAVVHHGVAYAPARAPEAVKQAIWATNAIRRKPYKWGGGHQSFNDWGYDCSGTVSYLLHGAGILNTPAQSSEFYGFGKSGPGRWISIYARPGHTFAMVAGLRLDTTGMHGTEGPRWHANGRDLSRFEVRHPPGL